MAMSRHPDAEPDLPDDSYWAAVGLQTRSDTGPGNNDGHRGRRFLREVVETVAAAAILFFVIQAMVQSYQVQGPSMEPSVHNNELLLVNKAVYFNVARSTVDLLLPFVDLQNGNDIYPFHPPRRGDIVVLRGPDGSTRDFIKRIVAIPGDTLELRRGELYVKDELVDEPYLADLDSRGSVGPIVIPPGSYYVLGDNRSVSRDSRSWGPISEEMIVGKAWIAYWPFGELGFLGHTPAPVSATST